MPVNKRYNLETLMGALRELFPDDSGSYVRPVALEYLMLK